MMTSQVPAVAVYNGLRAQAAPGGALEERLRLEASRGHTEEVVSLIGRGALVTPDSEGRTALHLACAGGHAETAAALLNAGCDANFPETSGHTALQRAAGEGHLEVVQQLIQHGVGVDHQDDVNGNTALHEAAWKGFSQTVELLLKARANMYLRNRGGFTALHLACQNGHNQSCRALLLAGCDPDIRNSYGDTPLHTSARYGHAGVMRILISGDASISEQNKNGDTALHIAAAMGRRKLTRILLEGGVDHSLRNKQEETALQIALRKEHTEIVEMLRTPPEVTRAARRRDDKRSKPESGSSSKEGSGKHVDKKKKSSKVHFEPKKAGGKPKKAGTKWSPYGCFYPPDLTEFPQPRLNTLPKEPLSKGEQYYLDLAGNIRKGPVGEGYTCYCAPFFRHVEDKLDKDKHELIHHIDITHDKLDKKIACLEKRTRTQLTDINELMRDRFSRERADCAERAEQAARRAQLELQQRQNHQISGVKDDLTAYLERRFSRLDVREARRRRQLARSRSEELLTDLSDDELYLNGDGPAAEVQAAAAAAAAAAAQYKGLRVRDQPTAEYPHLQQPQQQPPPARTTVPAPDRVHQQNCTGGPEQTDTPDTHFHPLANGGGARPKHNVLEVRNVHLPWPAGPGAQQLLAGYTALRQAPLSYNNPGYVQYEPVRTAGPAPPPAQFRPLEPEEAGDQHNDSGYSTRIYGSSQGPSPALSGAQEDDPHHHQQQQQQQQYVPARLALGPRIQALQTQLSRITEDIGSLEHQHPGIKSSLV